MQLGCGNVILTSLEVTDSCYYVTGIARDSLNCNLGALFMKYDTIGNLSLHKIYENMECWVPSLRTDYDGSLIVSMYNADAVFRGGVLKYDVNGDTLWSKYFYNPYVIGDFFRPDDVIVTKDSGYIVVVTVSEPAESGELNIIKIDKNRNIEWQISRNDTITAERIACVYEDKKDRGVIIGYMQDDLISGTQLNYKIRSKLEKIDSLGNTVWTYQSPSNQQIHGVNDLIPSKDGGLVIASAWGYERLNATGTFATFLHDGYVYKLDSAQNFLWGTRFRSPIYDASSFQKVIELEDSTLVAFGSYNRWHSNLGNFIEHGRIIKLSPQGDSIWSRDYEYLSTGGARHTVYDAERTHDGGFLICGEANGVDTMPSNPVIFQQGWLIKLDEEGCLVPGCHIVTSVLPIEQRASISLSLYPNPTVDYLNVHYYNKETKEHLTFSVVDLQGRVLSTYETYDQSDKTYIVPVSDLVVGMYVLEVRQEGVVIGSEQFVKQ